jgi:4-aminobutyrate aminotransferase-like enzyme
MSSFNSPSSEVTFKTSDVTKNALQRLKKFECPDTTFVGENFPLVITKGKGMKVWDLEDRSYLDFTACFGVLALGHRPPETLRALRHQSAMLIHGMGDVHPTLAKINLLELIATISPYENPKILLSQSGGDAVESALKTCLLATKKNHFLSFSGAYHGLQFAPLSLNDRPFFKEGFESWLKGRCTVLPFPYFFETSHSSEKAINTRFLKTVHKLQQPHFVLEKLEAALKTKKYAALILEPYQGRGGKRGFCTQFIKECKYLCQKYASLLVFDEIYTGFGRTGKMFALEHFGVVPDILCVGKAMGGGLPLSACLGDVLDVWKNSQGEAKQTQTFLGHPLACAVSYETIIALQKKLPYFQKELFKIEKEFLAFVQKMNSSLLTQKFPFQLRGKGFMRGLWFYTQQEGFAIKLMEKLLKKGFLVLPEGPRGDVLSLTPPLIARATHFKKILQVLFEELKNMA